MTKKKIDVYQMVTDRIIEKLENGVIPWKNPMQNFQAVNWKTGKAYRGINAILLDGGEYATFKVIKENGGKVKKGEKSQIAIFWKMWETEDNEGEKINIPLMRYYNVFEINTQVEGLESKRPLKIYDNDPIKEAEAIKDNYMGGPSYSSEMGGAWYRPSFDQVNIPPLKTFKNPSEYYSVLFHEMVHSTGHKDRLNREGIIGKISFGSQTYSKEELVAEIGASFLCNMVGIDNYTIDNSASYINSWLRKLRNDKKFIVSASQQAQKACDLILNTKF